MIRHENGEPYTLHYTLNIMTFFLFIESGVLVILRLKPVVTQRSFSPHSEFIIFLFLTRLKWGGVKGHRGRVYELIDRRPMYAQTSIQAHNALFHAGFRARSSG